MIFVIDYDRNASRIVLLETFEDGDGVLARDRRFAIELANRNAGVIAHEVVLLEAASEDDLRRTHGRYFETMEEIARR